MDLKFVSEPGKLEIKPQKASKHFVSLQPPGRGRSTAILSDFDDAVPHDYRRSVPLNYLVSG